MTFSIRCTHSILPIKDLCEFAELKSNCFIDQYTISSPCSPKFVHFFTIPSIVILFFVFMAQFPFQPSLMDGIIHVNEFVFDLNYGAVALIILMAAYIVMGFLRKSPLWGCTTAFCLVLCYIVVSFTFHCNIMNPSYIISYSYKNTSLTYIDHTNIVAIRPY